MIYEILFEPIPLARARASKHAFYDSQYHVKKNFRDYITDAYGKQLILEKPISVRYVFKMQIPKSWSQKKQKAHLNKHCDKKVDLTNLMKFVEDACNDFLWKDDSQIVETAATKLWSNQPSTVFQIDILE